MNTTVETKEQDNAEQTENGFNKTTRKNIHCIDPRRMKVNPNNEREIDITDPEFIMLLESIRVNGVRKDASVIANPDFGKITDEFPDGDPYEYMPTDGNCRLTAVKMLIAEGIDIKTMDCRIEKNGTLEHQLLAQIIENSGRQLNALAKSEVYRKLIEVCGYTPKQVSEATGDPQAVVSNLMAISAMPKKLKNLISKNHINSQLALQIVRESLNPTELEEKITLLENKVDEVLASGAKTTKRGTLTEKNVGDLVIKKKPLVILETVAAKLEAEGVENDKTVLLGKVIKYLTNQNANTQGNITKLFKV